MSVSFISEVDKGYEECYKPPVRRLKKFGMQIYLGQPVHSSTFRFEFHPAT
jgi:hypothetical protein